VDECIMFKCLQIMCAKYYELRCMFFNAASTFALFPVSDLKDEKLTNNKPT